MTFGANVPFIPDNVTVEQSGAGVLSVKDSGIDTTQLADASVTTIKLEDGAVTSDKIASGAVAMEVVQTLTSAGTDNFDFTGLDINTDGIYVIEVTFEGSGNIGDVYLYINNDTTATNYGQEYLLASASTASAGSGNNPRIFQGGNNSRGISRIEIHRSVSGYVFAQSLSFNGDTALLQNNGMRKNSTVTNVTQITLKGQSGGTFVSGSKATLYKLKR